MTSQTSYGGTLLLCVLSSYILLVNSSDTGLAIILKDFRLFNVEGHSTLIENQLSPLEALRHYPNTTEMTNLHYKLKFYTLTLLLGKTNPLHFFTSLTHHVFETLFVTSNVLLLIHSERVSKETHTLTFFHIPFHSIYSSTLNTIFEFK